MVKQGMKIGVVALLASVALTGCISQPVVVEVVQPNDKNLDCKKLQKELEIAEQYRNAAREDDHFMAKHMTIIPPIFSTINMNMAESAAIDRIEHLLVLYTNKQCGSISDLPIAPLPPKEENSGQEVTPPNHRR